MKIPHIKGTVIGYYGDSPSFHNNPFTEVGEIVEYPFTSCYKSPINQNHILVPSFDEYGSSALVLDNIEIIEIECELPLYNSPYIDNNILKTND